MKIWISILLLVLGGYGTYTGIRLYDKFNTAEEFPSKGTIVSNEKKFPPKKLTGLSSYELINSDGQPFDFKRLEGQVWVVNQFFTSCPSICRMVTGQLRDLQKDNAYDGVNFVSITSDPKSDTPKIIRKYAEGFKADFDRWFFLTGRIDIVKRFGYEVFSSTDTKDHSTRVFIIDRNGARHSGYLVDSPNGLLELKKDLIRMLKEDRVGPKIDPVLSGANKPKKTEKKNTGRPQPADNKNDANKITTQSEQKTE